MILPEALHLSIVQYYATVRVTPNIAEQFVSLGEITSELADVSDAKFMQIARCAISQIRFNCLLTETELFAILDGNIVEEKPLYSEPTPPVSDSLCRRITFEELFENNAPIKVYKLRSPLKISDTTNLISGKFAKYVKTGEWFLTSVVLREVLNGVKTEQLKSLKTLDTVLKTATISALTEEFGPFVVKL